MRNIYEDISTLIQNQTITNADLSYNNLKAIDLDGHHFTNINFTGANLTTANLSEAIFKNCTFDEACLIDTCFCESQFINCSFKHTRFGSTDICFVHMDACYFSGHSALTLNFITLRTLKACTYEQGAETWLFNKAPIVIQGLFNTPVALIGDSVIIGQKHIKLGTLPPSLSRYLLGHTLDAHAAVLIDNERDQKAHTAS